MIPIRGFSIVLLLLVDLPAMAFEAFSDGMDQPAGARGMVSREPAAPAGTPSVGVQEVPRPDGGRDVIYYSVTPPEEKRARQQAENHNREKSLETVRKVIILKP